MTSGNGLLPDFGIVAQVANPAKGEKPGERERGSEADRLPAGTEEPEASKEELMGALYGKLSKL